MKRRDLIRHLADQGCVLDREGGNHSIYRNPTNGRCAAIPRHREVKETLARRNNTENTWLRSLPSLRDSRYLCTQSPRTHVRGSSPDVPPALERTLTRLQNLLGDKESTVNVTSPLPEEEVSVLHLLITFSVRASDDTPNATPVSHKARDLPVVVFPEGVC